MNKFFQIIGLLICLNNIATDINAQNKIIRGQVVDFTTHNSIEFATVSIAKKDSSIIQNTVTNKSGTFSLKSAVDKEIILRVKFIGYKTFDTALVINENVKDINILVISLIPSSSSLKEVTVVGQRNTSLVHLDKQIIQVSKFANAANGTGLDIIQRMPSVTLNTEGTILLRGSSEFQILINGKLSNRPASDVLAQLPSNSIESVELITTPSASYDAEGKGGIINIVTRKNALKGWSIAGNGMFGGTTPARYSSDISASYNGGKWNTFLSADFRQFNINGYRIGEIRTIYHDTVNYLPSDGIRPLKERQYGVRGGTSYSPNHNNTFNIGYYYGYKQTDRTANLHYNEYTQTNQPLDLYKQNWSAPSNQFYNQNLFIRTGDFFTVNGDYTHIFKSNQKLSLLGSYEHSILGGPLTNQNNDEVSGVLTLKERSDERSPLNAYRLQADYSIPLLNKNRFDFGYQWRYIHHQGDFTFERLNISNGVWEKDPGFNDNLDLKQVTHSGYAQFSGLQKSFAYNVGLRTEYMNRDFTHALGNSPLNVTQFNLFPSVQGIWSLKGNQKIRLGYSKRIDRPTTRLMSPFKNHRHSEFIEVGDPTLLPEVTDVIELSYTKNWNNISFTATPYFNKVKNKIFRVNVVYSPITLLRTFTNGGNTTSAGMEFSSDIKVASWLRFYVSGNVYQLHVDGTIKGVEVSQSGTNYNVNGNASVDISKQLKFQIDGNYLSRTITAQGEEGNLFLSNAGLRYIWNGKITTGLLLQNIFNSNHQTITNKGNDFFVNTNYIKYDRVLQLNVSFRLNDAGKKAKSVKTEYGEKDF